MRADLNKRAPRVQAVLHPLKVVITNYPEGQVEMLDAVNNPEDPAAGTRQTAVLAELYDRTGRLPRSTAEEVLSPYGRPRSATAHGAT